MDAGFVKPLHDVCGLASLPGRIMEPLTAPQK